MKTVECGPPAPDASPVAFGTDGLLPVIAQDAATNAVLLLAFMNAEALRATLDEGMLVLWSRSRQALWRKGEQSGHVLRMSELRLNCEGNCLLARVRLEGPGACHDGYYSCYHRRLERDTSGKLVASIVETRTFNPATVYGSASHATAGSDTRPAAAGDRHAPVLERDARALYAGYEALRDTDASATSGTSRLLRASAPAHTAVYALERAREELDELRGVIASTHRHDGDDRDVLLEAGQVEYWAFVAVIATGQHYDSWHPHEAWLAGWRGAEPAEILAETPAHNLGDEFAQLPLACAALLAHAGACCRARSIHPARVVAADLAALRAKHPQLA